MTNTKFELFFIACDFGYCYCFTKTTTLTSWLLMMMIVVTATEAVVNVKHRSSSSGVEFVELQKYLLEFNTNTIKTCVLEAGVRRLVKLLLICNKLR